MFGYAVPDKQELKFREYDYFKTYYCGVCKSIGRQYGHVKRFGLVNELGMLAMLLDCISRESGHVLCERKPCIAHPCRKSPSVVQSLYCDYAASVNVMFIYYKLLDSWQDDKNIFSAVGARLAFRRAARKAGRKYPEVFSSMQNHIQALHRAETEGMTDLDPVCDCFADLMADIFTMAPDIQKHISIGSDYDTREKLVALRDLGYYIGKWIYLIDALFDMEEDIQKKHYNPILQRYGYDSGKESSVGFRQKIQEDLEFILFDALGHAASAWQLLTEDLPDTPYIRSAKGYMDNLLYLGMRAKTRKGLERNESV